jgi:hypothetical protein
MLKNLPCLGLFAWLLLLPSFVVAQNINATLQVAGYTLHYEFAPISANKYQFTIKNIANANTDKANFSLVYSSQAQIIKNASKIKEVRIYAAQNSQANAVNWTVSLTECLRLLFDVENNGKTANFQTAGTMLDNYLTGAKPQTADLSPTSTDKEVLKVMAAQFIKSYYKILNLDTTKKGSSSEKGSITAPNAKQYDYEIGQGRATTDKEFYIRQGENGLVLRTVMKIVSNDNKLVLRILYAKQKDFSWEIYGSDFWEMTFDKTTKQATAKKEGLFVPPVVPLPQSLGNSTPQTEADILRLAAQWFAISYADKLF